MAEFRLRCPKCFSTRVEAKRDAGARWGSWAREGLPLLHCSTCGKQVFGAEAEAEVARQQAAWDKKAEEARLAAEEAARRAAEPIPLAPGPCAWRECDKPHGDWSKYCSVNCRHKAARWTYDVKVGRVKLPEAAVAK